MSDIQKTNDIQKAPARKRELPKLMRLTEAAAARLRTLYEGAERGRLLRIGVNTRGCSGMSYDMSWTDEVGPGDELVNDHGVSVLVDRKATLFLIGTEMDYQEGTLESGFSFTNPNEKARCGCGESFSV